MVSCIYNSKVMQKLLKMKTLSYSYAKYSLRVSLLLLTVEKIQLEYFDFVLFFLLSFFLSFSSSSFPSRVTQKVYGIY